MQTEDHLLGSIVLVSMDDRVFEQLPGNEEDIGGILHFHIIEDCADHLDSHIYESDIGLEFEQKRAGINRGLHHAYGIAIAVP